MFETKYSLIEPTYKGMVVLMSEKITQIANKNCNLCYFSTIILKVFQLRLHHNNMRVPHDTNNYLDKDHPYALNYLDHSYL